MAVINITLLTDINALIASDNVNEGDALLLEEGIYFQTVNILKSNIRIVAKRPGVILDGKDILFTTITLSNVVGVGIEGINIRNYRFENIIIRSGSGNRIINNRIISDPLSDGIEIVGSSGNLIWKNEICDSFKGRSLVLHEPYHFSASGDCYYYIYIGLLRTRGQHCDSRECKWNKIHNGFQGVEFSKQV
ncbi:hypothetical protein [Lutispora sp.]|uniref:hypothetical protein n=1 Tax=Lutispora sp. TaxID=2828727 RepID=UPI00356301FA